MSYIDYEEKLDKTVQGLPQTAQAVFAEQNIISAIEEIGDSFEITFGEIGEVCELVRQVIVKELPVEKFEESLKEKLDEDNQPRTGEITAMVNEKIFVKLLPTLGMKALPLILTATAVNSNKTEIKFEGDTGTAVAESARPPSAPLPNLQTSELPNFQTSQLTSSPPRAVPIRKIIPPTYKSPAPIPANLPSADSFSLPHQTPSFKTNLAEPSHEKMSDNPMESLMKMLDGKVNESELKKRFDKLPESLKTALKSVDSAKKVVDVGRKHALHVDKIGELGAETGKIILGFTHPSQFLSRLSRLLDTSDEQTRLIAQEINTEIFLKIREALKEINGESVDITEHKIMPSVQQPEPQPPKISQIIPKAPLSEILVKTPPQSSSFGTIPPPPPPPYQNEALIKPMVETGQETKPEGSLRQETDSGETLTRETILRDIENPGVQPESQYSKSIPVAQNQESEIANQHNTNTRMKTNNANDTNINEPTEIKPEPTPERNVPEIISPPPIVPPPIAPPPAPLSPPPEPPPAVSSPPLSELAPLRSPTNTVSLIDRKLSAPTVSEKSESSYRLDPYREPLQ